MFQVAQPKADEGVSANHALPQSSSGSEFIICILGVLNSTFNI
jgi:hypothetical protein